MALFTDCATRSISAPRSLAKVTITASLGVCSNSVPSSRVKSCFWPTSRVKIKSRIRLLTASISFTEICCGVSLPSCRVRWSGVISIRRRLSSLDMPTICWREMCSIIDFESDCIRATVSGLLLAAAMEYLMRGLRCNACQNCSGTASILVDSPLNKTPSSVTTTFIFSSACSCA